MGSMDTFAAAWLDQWADQGGAVTLSEERIQLSYPSYTGSPNFAAEMAGADESFRSHRQNWLDGRHTGKIQALMEMLDSIPSARDALVGHMEAHGLCQYYNVQKDRVHAC